MAMPADAITTILGLNPKHLWTMRETVGSTFADEVSVGNLPLTAGAGCTPAGWGQIYGYRYNGGPGTQAPMFNGSATGYAQAAGSPIGSTLNGAGSYPGWAVLAYVESTLYKPTTAIVYSEAATASTDHISFRLNSGSPRLVYHDDTSATLTVDPPTNSNGIFGGSSPHGPRKGGQLIGCSVDTTGHVFFFRNGLFTAGASPTVLPTTVAWTGASLLTSVGFDPQVTTASWNGALTWVCVFPTYITPSQFYTIYSAISPEPTNGNRWSISRSGKFFPNSQLWNEKIASTAPVDPNSTAIMKQWMDYNASHGVFVSSQIGIPCFDLDHTGRAPTQGIRSQFLGVLDQHAYLTTAVVPDTFDAQDPRPGNLGSDALSTGAQPSTGQTWEAFQVYLSDSPRTAARATLWSAYINTTTVTAGVGTLPLGFYYYIVTAVTATGTESSFFRNIYGADVEGHLTATGKITLNMFGDLGGTHPPVQYRVYRRGPYGVATASANWNDYGLLTTIGDGVTPGGGLFTANVQSTWTDDGSFGTPNTALQPPITFSHEPSLPEPGGLYTVTVATAVGGANVAGQKFLNVSAVYSNYVFSSSRAGMGKGTVLTIGSGGTLETATVAAVPYTGQVQLQTNLLFTHSVGESVTHLGNLWGGSGTEYGSDVSSIGGGGGWDWWANAAFNPVFPFTNAPTNGMSAASKSCAAGVIMVGETCSSFTGTIAGGSLNTITGTGTPPTALNVGGAVAGDSIVRPLRVTSFTPGTTWTAVLSGSASGAITNGTFYAGLIQHPIGFEMPTLNQYATTEGRRWPANRHDGSAGTTTTLFPFMEGMRFHLPVGFDETDVHIPYSTIPTMAVAQMAYLIAIRDYGAIDHDSGVVGGGPYYEDTPQTGREEWPAITAGLDIDDPIFSNYSTFTASITNGNNILTGLPTGVSYPASVAIGAFVAGPGIPVQTHVTAIDTVAGTATLDKVATSGSTGGTFFTGISMYIQVLSAFRYPTKTDSLGRRTNRTDVGTPSTPGFQQLVAY